MWLGTDHRGAPRTPSARARDRGRRVSVDGERLLSAGFASARCWLQPAPREPEHAREFLSTIVLGPHVQQLPAELRSGFMDEVLAAVGEPVVVDYVRLNIDATA